MKSRSTTGLAHARNSRLPKPIFQFPFSSEHCEQFSRMIFVFILLPNLQELFYLSWSSEEKYLTSLYSNSLLFFFSSFHIRLFYSHLKRIIPRARKKNGVFAKM